MKKYLIVFLLVSSPALSQEQTYTFKLTQTQANIIMNALGSAPYITSAPVIAEIQKQAAEQNKPVEKPKK